MVLVKAVVVMMAVAQIINGGSRGLWKRQRLGQRELPLCAAGDGGNGNVWWRGNSHAAQLSGALCTAAVTVLSWSDGSPPFDASGPHSTGGIICYYESEGVSLHAMDGADTIHLIAGGAVMLP